MPRRMLPPLRPTKLRRIDKLTKQPRLPKTLKLKRPRMPRRRPRQIPRRLLRMLKRRLRKTRRLPRTKPMQR